MQSIEFLWYLYKYICTDIGLTSAKQTIDRDQCDAPHLSTACDERPLYGWPSESFEQNPRLALCLLGGICMYGYNTLPIESSSYIGDIIHWSMRVSAKTDARHGPIHA